MLKLEERITILSTLGDRLGKYLTDGFPEAFESAMVQSKAFNPWFTQENVRFALESITNMLSREKLEVWLNPYLAELKKVQQRNIAVIMAGNIPVVGFHDFLSVFIAGHTFIGKLSTQDAFLLPALVHEMAEIEPSVNEVVRFVDGKLTGFDAVIATGSNNSSRYFDYYFGKYPHIIRRNRNSIAILTGDESAEELMLLTEDICRYYGLGCRNVTKLYVPEGYNFSPLIEKLEAHRDLFFTHNKYMNNYEYNKSILLINRIKHLDSGFILLKEDVSFASPISVLNYEYYQDIADIWRLIDENKENIQCVVSGKPYSESVVAFGKSQSPELWDYADGVNTLTFLFSLH